MLSEIELIKDILHLQNLTMFLQAQLREARKMQEQNWFVAHPEVTRYILQHEQAQELIGRMCAAPLVIQYHKDDEITHTDEHSYCGDETCPCMDELYDEVERQEQHEPGDERYYR